VNFGALLKLLLQQTTRYKLPLKQFSLTIGPDTFVKMDITFAKHCETGNTVDLVILLESVAFELSVRINTWLWHKASFGAILHFHGSGGDLMAPSWGNSSTYADLSYQIFTNQRFWNCSGIRQEVLLRRSPPHLILNRVDVKQTKNFLLYGQSSVH
jgi:hypothetical protein